MELLDADATQIREVYACFGLASYQAQCVERQLAVLLATVHGPGLQNITRSQYDELLEALFKKTLGALINTLRQSTAISADFDQNLRDTLQKRNWLIHHYFWDRAGHFLTEHGRDFMVNELNTIATQLDELDGMLTTIGHAWTIQMGISEEMREAEMEKLIRAAQF